MVKDHEANVIRDEANLRNVIANEIQPFKEQIECDEIHQKMAEEIRKKYEVKLERVKQEKLQFSTKTDRELNELKFNQQKIIKQKIGLQNKIEDIKCKIN